MSDRTAGPQPTKWVILVGGYGAFLFDGTEAEAETMRCHKAQWEGGIGLKRPATLGEIANDEASECMNHDGFNNRGRYADCPCGECE